MATYLIGDVHGCFDALLRLLKKIDFRPSVDFLYFTGDLVNRGPQSLEVLQWVLNQEERVFTVLGNHDLHLIGRALGAYGRRRGDTLEAILSAPNCGSLVDELRARPLVIDASHFLIVHAGLHHAWSLQDVLACATRLSKVLKASDGHCATLLADVFRPTDVEADPLYDNSTMSASEALRVFTQLRFCQVSGQPDYEFSGAPEDVSGNAVPWFEVKNRNTQHLEVCFGHWAALGFYRKRNVLCIDTGCAWGRELSAFCVETEQRFCVPFLPVAEISENPHR